MNGSLLRISSDGKLPKVVKMDPKNWTELMVNTMCQGIQKIDVLRDVGETVVEVEYAKQHRRIVQKMRDIAKDVSKMTDGSGGLIDQDGNLVAQIEHRLYPYGPWALTPSSWQVNMFCPTVKYPAPSYVFTLSMILDDMRCHLLISKPVVSFHSGSYNFPANAEIYLLQVPEPWLWRLVGP